MNKDLTQGKPVKVLWMFCLPILVSAVFQQLYNMADSIIARQSAWRECACRRRGVLSHHDDIHRHRVRVQPRMLCGDLQIFRRKELSRSAFRRVHGRHSLRGARRGAHGDRRRRRARADGRVGYSRRHHGRRDGISLHLHRRLCLRAHLQRMHGGIFRPRRQPHPAHIPHRVQRSQRRLGPRSRDSRGRHSFVREWRG